MVCACCGTEEGVRLEDSRTAYDPGPTTRYQRLTLDDPLNDEAPDPNAPVPLCTGCAESHNAYWDEMWSVYYGSRL